MKAEGDRFQSANQARIAYDKYNEAAALGSGSGDPEVKKAVNDAITQRNKLQVLLKSQLDREEEERRNREESQRLIAMLKAKEEAEAKARQEAERRRQEEESRLATIQADITGGAWVIKKVGQSDIIRGLKIYLIKSILAKDEWSQIIDYLKGKEDFEKMGPVVKSLANTGGDAPVDIKGIYEAIREKDLNDTESMRFINIRYDTDWSGVVLGFSYVPVAETITNIDGKYKFSNIKGGHYYIYSVYKNEYSLMEWMVPVAIESPGEISIDLFNETAEIILNKSGD